MALSVELGHPLEIEALNGTTVRMGRELGIPTPANGFIYAALKLLAKGRPA
jgi:2-dehydropantoate 2-reductase